MSVLQQLVQRSEGGNADVELHAAPAAEGSEREEAEVEEPVTGDTKTAADRAREIIAGVPELYAQCVEMSASLRTEMEKTASEGGDASEAEQASAFFLKIAQALSVQKSYMAALTKRADGALRTCEALKVASDLMGRDLLEVSEGQTMLQVVEELAKKDLKAVKVASQMFTDAAVTNAMGTAEKLASDKNPTSRMDGSMASWTDAHAWLFK